MKRYSFHRITGQGCDQARGQASTFVRVLTDAGNYLLPKHSRTGIDAGPAFDWQAAGPATEALARALIADQWGPAAVDPRIVGPLSRVVLSHRPAIHWTLSAAELETYLAFICSIEGMALPPATARRVLGEGME